MWAETKGILVLVRSIHCLGRASPICLRLMCDRIAARLGASSKDLS